MYEIRTSRDYFTEAQPENIEDKEIYQVEILDAKTGELYDTDTGYDTEKEARASGEAQVKQYN